MTDLRERFRAHYEREVAFLYNLLRRLGVRPVDIEDVAQEVFTRVFHKLETYDESRPFRPWLTAFAVPASVDYHRKQNVRAEPVHVGPANARPASEQLEAHQLVLQGLDALDGDLRRVLVLHDLYGHTMNEVAEILGIGTEAGYSRLRIARARFAETVRRSRREMGP